MDNQSARAAFDRQAPVFDNIYGNDGIVAYKRKRVRDHLSELLPASANILELNAGTGDDAIWLASNGHTVHATDISVGMQTMLKQKRDEAGLEDRISTEICSFEELDHLNEQGPYDAVFSNFAGLNCSDRLDHILKSLPTLVKKGGTVTMVILPSFCLWEFLLLFLGKFRTAFRRSSGRKGAKAHIEGAYFRCWYYSPAYVKKFMPDEFELADQEGLCSLVFPSYLQDMDKKHPRAFRWLVKLEERWKRKWPWRSIGDYYIISFRKK